MLHKKAIEDIKFEISEIEHELNSFSHLLKLCQDKEPDLVEMAALGSLLHSFYTGIEKIFFSISKQIDKKQLSGIMWHKELIISMTIETEQRPFVISQDVFNSLLQYLNFRHYFRNAYEYKLDWDKIKTLVFSINDIWLKTKMDINKFIEKINS